MDPSSNAIWKTNSICPQSEVNDTSEFAKNNASEYAQNPSFVILSALAVPDKAICICNIFLTVGHTNVVTAILFGHIMVMFVTFSILLLVFVSIERLLPVRRSHTFSRNSKRAKRHTLVFLELAVLFTVTCRLAKRNTYIVFEVIAKTSLLAVSVLIMVTCCMFIGMTLLKMTMVSCNKIAENNLMELSNQNCNLSKSSLAQEIVSKKLLCFCYSFPQ